MMRATDNELSNNGLTDDGDESTQNTLRLDIGHLRLPWLTRHERALFTQSLQAELERLTADYDGSVWAGIEPTRVDRLDIGEAPPNASPQELGRKVAARLIEKLAGPRGVRTDV
jgi:hypothetical protein